MWQIEQLVVPESMDAADSTDFATNCAIVAACESLAYGTDDLALSPAEVLPSWQDPGSPRRLFGVRVDGRLVARAMTDHLLADPSTAWNMVCVLSEFRGRGIGTALADHLEQLARDEGRAKLLVYAVSPDAPGERIEAQTGFGSVPASNTEVRFLLDRGYRLEQIERASRLALPVDVAVEPPEAYRLHYWAERAPERWRDDLALLYTRMSTDAPSAGLDEPADEYTVERILELEEAHAQSPRTQITAAVEHIETGRLAGFTTLSVPAERDRAVLQDDTLVLKEHRGHRLGMLLKVANIDHLQRTRPGHPSIITFNAEENRYMLDVNEAVGFVPMGYEGAWRKDL